MGLISGLLDLLGFFTDLFRNLITSLMSAFLWVISTVWSTLSAFIQIAKDLLDWVVSAVQWVISAAGNLISSIWRSIVTFVNDAIEWILTEAGKIIDFVVKEIAKAIPVIASALGPLLVPLFAGLGLFLLIRNKDKDKGGHPA
jgi:phage-related protein